MKVVVLDDYFDTVRTLPCFSMLQGHDVTIYNDHTDDLDELTQRLIDADAVVLIRERTAIRKELVERLPRLRLISQRSVFPHIDVAACSARGIVVCSNLHADTPSYATAELTFGLALAAARQIPQQSASLRAGAWQSGVGRTLRGKKFGVFSYGRIGSVVAGYARAFAMGVVAWGRPDTMERARADGVEVADSQRDLFERCDVVSLHLRLVEATHGIVRYDDLAAMREGSILINTSRAGLIESGALARAMRAGRPSYAAVDVFDHEPMTDPTNELLSLPGVVATPHIGYVTLEEWDLQFTDIFEQIVAFDAGHPINVVNPEVLGS